MAVDTQKLRREAHRQLVSVGREVEEKALQLYGSKVNVSIRECDPGAYFWGRVFVNMRVLVNEVEVAVLGLKRNGHWCGRLFLGERWSHMFTLGKRVDLEDDEVMDFMKFSLLPSVLTHAYFLGGVYSAARQFSSFSEMSFSVGCTKDEGVVFRFVSLPSGKESTEKLLRRYILKLNYTCEGEVIVSLFERDYLLSTFSLIYTGRLNSFQVDVFRDYLENVLRAVDLALV